MYNDATVEKLMMDISSNIIELENAWAANPKAVKSEINLLRDSAKSLEFVTGKIVAGIV